MIYSAAYQSKALELMNSAIPLSCPSAHRGCAGIGRQLHPLKDEGPNMFPHVRPFTGMSLFLSVCLSIHPAVCPSDRCPSVRSSVCSSVHPSRFHEISEQSQKRYMVSGSLRPPLLVSQMLAIQLVL